MQLYLQKLHPGTLPYTFPYVLLVYFVGVQGDSRM